MIYSRNKNPLAMADNTENIKDLMLETAKVQMAALDAGISFWKIWIEVASEYSKTVSEALLDMAENDSDRGEVLSKITDSGRTMLREMSKLPDQAVKKFNEELEKTTASNKGKRPSRAAKAKE